MDIQKPNSIVQKDRFQTMANTDMQKLQTEMNGLNLNNQQKPDPKHMMSGENFHHLPEINKDQFQTMQ